MTDQDLYSPPKANLETPARIPPSRPIRGIVIGTLVDIGGTLLASMVLGFVLVATHVEQVRRPEEISALLVSPPWLQVAEFVGGLFSILGGYICARYARTWEYRYAGIMIFCEIVLPLVWTGAPLAKLSAMLMGAVAVLAGAHLGRRANQHDREPAGIS